LKSILNNLFVSEKQKKHPHWMLLLLKCNYLIEIEAKFGRVFIEAYLCQTSNIMG
jgi:hypothetical protein